MKNQLKLTKKLWLILCCLITVAASAQEVEVKGTVIGQETGMPLPGVTIIVEGTQNGTTTDFDGNYSITASSPDARLVFSYIGFAEQTIVVGNQQTINVSLKPALMNLDEVVVVGYGTVKKRDLTGAVSSVKGTSMEKGSPVSLQNALAGRVAGVQISQTDNAPGAGMRVLIRGGSTLTGGNQPLYVIDNFPIMPNDDPSQNPLADLNPNDIESVEILKDASATAVFGAEGANGVILITTKLGKAGKPRIDVNYSSGLSKITNIPDILTPNEYLNWQIEKGPITKFYDPSIYTEAWRAIRDSGQKGNVWIDRITRPAQTHNADISFSGGAEGMQYRLSAGYLGQEGVIDNSEFNRTNLSANLEQKISEKIKIGTTLTYAKKEAVGMVNTWDESAVVKTALQLNPFMPEDFRLDDVVLDDPTYVWNSENVLTFMDEVDISSVTERVIGNLFFQYKLAKGLSFYTSYGINSLSDNYQEFYPSSVQRGFNIGGFAKFRNRETLNTAYQARLNFNRTFKKKHNFTATAVFESKTAEMTDKSFGAEGFEDESRGLYDLSSVRTAYFPSNLFTDFTSLSYLGRFGYNYDSKYLLTASYRADASSKFGKNNKWGYFPSLALAWVASEEDFVKKLNTFDLLKLRLSYGKTGNNQIPTYQSLASLETVRYIFDDNLYVGLVPGSVANPDLKWETTEQYNIGLDLAFFENRLTITADAYYKETKDLLLEVQLPQTSGFDKAIQNVGAISNKGFELAINSVNANNKDFKWNSAFTFSINRSKVLDLGEQNELFFSRQFHFRLRDEVLVRKGESIGRFYGYIEDEIFNSENEIANSPNQLILENVAGGVKIKDVNGDGIINNNDKVLIADTQPDFIGGLNNEFTYKNFDLSFFLRWSYGNDVINGNVVFLDRVGAGNWNTLQGYVNNAFSPLNTEGTIHGQVPDTYGNLMRSSYVEDGSFLKCDYITLGYMLPENLMAKSNIKKLRIYARVNNPFMITRYSWFDPEVSTGFGTVSRVAPGVDVGSYPRATTFTLGASIGL